MSDILWAPWRIKYIEAPKDSTDVTGDIFVDLPAEDDDRKNLILYRGVTAFAMLNAFPYTNGHLMVAPYRRIDSIELLDDAELLEINQLVARSVRWLKECYRPDGFNVGINLGSAAGAGIPIHVHWHIVPRWSGDTNFMTTVGQIRVMPQSLEESYDRLLEVVLRDA
jgi:ATP adenylyltransferase